MKQVLLGRKRFNELANITKFKWRFDRRSGNCNSSNYKLTRKKIGDFNRIQIHGLCVSAAVLYQLSYEDPYIGSRPIFWVHFNPRKKWNLEWRWCELRKYKFKWRYDRRSGNCNLSRCKLTLQKFRDVNGILKKSSDKGKLLEKMITWLRNQLLRQNEREKNCSKSFKWEISVETVHHALLNWQSQKGTLNIHC